MFVEDGTAADKGIHSLSKKDESRLKRVDQINAHVKAQKLNLNDSPGSQKANELLDIFCR